MLEYYFLCAFHVITDLSLNIYPIKGTLKVSIISHYNIKYEFYLLTLYYIIFTNFNVLQNFEDC